MSQIFYFGLLKKVLLFFDKCYLSERKLPKAEKMGKSAFFVNNQAKYFNYSYLLVHYMPYKVAVNSIP